MQKHETFCYKQSHITNFGQLIMHPDVAGYNSYCRCDLEQAAVALSVFHLV